MTIIIALVVLIIFLLIGVPIAFCYLAAALVFVIFGGYDPSFLMPHGFSQINAYILIAVPLFIASGNIMNEGKIGEKLIDFVDVFVGRIKGGLGVVTCVTCAVFGAITGSAFATASSVGSIMVDKLKGDGYPRGYIGALIASTSVLGLLIPPSGNIILYCWVGNQSVLKCFLAIATPGVLLTIVLSIINLVLMRNVDLKVSEKIPRKEIAKKFVDRGFSALPALFLPVIILGGIYSGILTTTEAAAVGAFYAIPVGFLIYKGLTWKTFKKSLIDTGYSTGTIFVMFFAIMILSRIIIMENLPQKIVVFLMSLSINRNMILFMMNIFMVMLGMLVDDASGTLLSTPILLPIALELGVDPVHFAAILAVNLGMGNITPPTAPLLFVGAHLSGAHLDEMIGYTMVFIIFGWLPILFITTYFPSFSLWLPRLVLGM